jgi:hypothetical protein
MRCLDGADADPLGVRSATAMGVLLIILVVTIGLSVRAGLYRRRWTLAEPDTETGDEPWLMEACARTLVLVLLSLLGLLALGVMYGNVLGAVHAGP